MNYSPSSRDAIDEHCREVIRSCLNIVEQHGDTYVAIHKDDDTTVYKATGKGNEYEKCGRLRLKVKNPELRIDRLKDIPEGVIAIEMDQAVAKKLFGQTIAIRCYDNTVEHTVGEVNGSYWFKVDIGSQEGESNYEEEP